MPKDAAYQIVNDELMLDGNPRLNLASFVTTWMEHECEKLIMASINKNYVYMDEYPVTTELQQGYAVIDLVILLNSMEVVKHDIYLAKFVALVVQFISQRHRPVRGNGLKLLLNYLRTLPCKTCLTVAGCYLCPAPGSKGTKVPVCCSVDSSVTKLSAYTEQKHDEELEQIVRNIEANLDNFIMPDVSGLPFLGATPGESVLIEARKLGILSESSHKAIVSLQKQESENFIKPKAAKTIISDSSESQDNIITYLGSKSICPGQVGYFMNRFLLDWKVVCSQCNCFCCLTVAQVRHMVDTDWMYIYDLSNKIKMKQLSGDESMDCAISSAGRALASLKSIPIAARSSMPVLINSEGLLLSVPDGNRLECLLHPVAADYLTWILLI